jgi:hypothetical protein
MRYIEGYPQNDDYFLERESVQVCVIRQTSLGGGVICSFCSDDCECVVCDADQPTNQLMVDMQPWADADGRTTFDAFEVRDLATRVRDQGYTDVWIKWGEA